MDYRVEVIGTAPLALRFGFVQPSEAGGPALVPRLIHPAGYFVEAALRSLGGEEVFRTTRPKAKLKLRPEREESYLELNPGYAYEAVLRLDTDRLRSGDYVLRVEYSNHEFEGPRSSPIGPLHHVEEIDVSVP
jgi:hypothetical protein